MGSSIKMNKSGVVGLIAASIIIVLVYRNATSSKTATQEIASDVPDGELISMKELLSVAIDAARRGGDEVSRVDLHTGLHWQLWKSNLLYL